MGSGASRRRWREQRKRRPRNSRSSSCPRGRAKSSALRNPVAASTEYIHVVAAAPPRPVSAEDLRNNASTSQVRSSVRRAAAARVLPRRRGQGPDRHGRAREAGHRREVLSALPRPWGIGRRALRGADGYRTLQARSRGAVPPGWRRGFGGRAEERLGGGRSGVVYLASLLRIRGPATCPAPRNVRAAPAAVPRPFHGPAGGGAAASRRRIRCGTALNFFFVFLFARALDGTRAGLERIPTSPSP